MAHATPVPVEALLAHKEWVRRVARALVPDDARADDLQQEVWCKAIAHPPRHGGSLKAWLGTVLRRTAWDARRSERRRAAREEAVARPERTVSTSDLVAEAEALRRVVSEVLALEEPCRTTLLLRYVDDLPVAAIAERMGSPCETVRTRLRRSIERLRERFGTDRGRESRSLAAGLLSLARRAGTEPKDAVGGVSSAVPVLAGVLVTAKAKWLAASVLLLLLAAGAAWWASDGGASRAERGSAPAETSAGGENGPATLSGRSAPPTPTPDGVRAATTDSGGGSEETTTVPVTATAAVLVEVLDERGDRLREGKVRIGFADLRTVDVAWLSEPDRYGWLLDDHDLAAGNPVSLDRIPSEFAGWALEASATVPGSPPSEPSPFRLEAGKVVRVRLDVVPARTLVLDVRESSADRPVPGATVLVLTELDRRRIQANEVDSAAGPGWATTSEDGRATVEGLGAGRHDVEVLAEGFRAGRLRGVAAGAPPVVLRLERSHDAGVLEVSVIGPEGDPVPDFPVELSTRGRRTPLVGRTDGRGVARFAGLAPGIQFARVGSKAWAKRAFDSRWPEDPALALSSFVDLAEGAAGTLVLGYPRGSGVVRCEVVDGEGRPVGGIAVTIAGTSRRRGRTDGAGRVAFEGLLRGPHRLVVERSEAWFDVAAREVADGATLEARRILGERAIRGTVHTASEGRSPVEGAWVTASGAVSATTQTTADGSFVLADAPPGTYRLEVTSDEFARGEAAVDVTRDADPAPVEVRLGRGGRILVDAEARDLDALAAARWTLVDAGGEAVSLRPDASGAHFRTTGPLRPGRYVLTIAREGAAPVARTIDVAEGKDSRISIEAP